MDALKRLKAAKQVAAKHGDDKAETNKLAKLLTSEGVNVIRSASGDVYVEHSEEQIVKFVTALKHWGWKLEGKPRFDREFRLNKDDKRLIVNSPRTDNKGRTRRRIWVED